MHMDYIRCIKNRHGKTHSGSRHFAIYFYTSVCCMLLLLIAVALCYTFVTMPDIDRVFPDADKSYILYIISGSVLLFALLFLGYRQIIRISYTRYAVVVCFGIIVFIQFFISRIEINPITDCFTTIDEAVAMVTDQKGMLNNNMPYFARYTNNYCFTILMYYYFRIIRHTGMDYFYSAVILNIICIDLTVFICYKIVRVLFGKKRAAGLLFLMTLCPATYLFVNFPYTNTFSMPFITGVLYCGICLMKEKSEKRRLLIYFPGLVLAASAGTLVRPTTAIAFMAVIISMVTRKKSFRYIYTMGAVFLVLVMLLCGNRFIKMHLINPDNTEGFPATHWVMMGLSGKGEVNSEDVKYTKSFSGRQEKIKANIEVIKERAANLGLKGMTALAVTKIRELWSVGTDNFNVHHSSAVRYTDAYELIYGNRNGWLIFYCQIFRAAELFFAFIMIAHMIGTKSFYNMSSVILSLLGIIVFLMCWETNRKHNICFIPVLIIIMESGVNCCRDIKERVRFPAVIFGMTAVFILGDVCIIKDKPYFTDTNRVINDYSYYRLSTRLKDIDNIITDNKCVEQTFITFREFNMIAVRFRPDDIAGDYAGYNISLYKQNHCVESAVADINNIDGEGWYYMPCNEKEGSYMLRIEKEAGRSDTMSPMVMTGIKMTPYRNTQLYVNKNKKSNSLLFYAYNIVERPLISSDKFMMLFIIVLMMQVGTVYTMLRRSVACVADNKKIMLERL